MTYSEIVAIIEKYIQAPDVQAQIPSAIAFAEEDINDFLRTAEMEARWQTETIDTLQRYPVPSDFGGLRAIRIKGSRYRPNYVTPQAAVGLNFSGSIDAPGYYTIEDEQIVLIPCPQRGTTVEFLYHQIIPALTDTAPTNWLSERSPSVYVFGALVHLHDLRYDVKESALYKGKFHERLQGIRHADRKDTWSGGALAVKAI